MIKLTETKNIYSFEIKKKKDILFNFSFSLTQDNKYKIIYNLYFDKVEKYFKNNETGIVAKGYLARILSHFYHEFKIKPDNEKQGFDFSLDIEFSGNIDEYVFINRFKDYEKSLKNILKNLEIILTRENINDIINYFTSKVDKEVENLIVYEPKTRKIYLVNKDIEVQDKYTLGVYLNEDDISNINKMKKPIFIHNHSNNLTFSKEDYEVYSRLKEIINVEFLFMVLNLQDFTLKEIKTNTVFS